MTFVREASDANVSESNLCIVVSGWRIHEQRDVSAHVQLLSSDEKFVHVLDYTSESSIDQHRQQLSVCDCVLHSTVPSKMNIFLEQTGRMWH